MEKKLAIINNYADLEKVATAMAASGYFQDSQKASQAIVKIMAGQELGIGPFASMSGIHIISGKPAPGANIIASLIKSHPEYDYRVIKLDDAVCEIEYFESGKSVGISKFTIEDARKAGTKNLDKFPRNMLFARCMSNGAKWFVPGIFNGAPVYTPEELGADIDEDGNVISGTWSETQPEPVVEAQPEQQKSTEITRPMDAETLKTMLIKKASTFGGQECTEQDRNMLAANIEMCFQGSSSTSNRKTIMRYLFGTASTKELSCAEVLAAKSWLKVTQDSGGEWKPDPMAEKEANKCLTEALKSEGQNTLL